MTRPDDPTRSSCRPAPRGDGTLSRRRLLGAAGTVLLVAPATFGRAGSCPSRAAADAAEPESQAAAPTVLVLLFLRGGVDGLSLAVPYTDPVLPRRRPDLLPFPERRRGAGLRPDRVLDDRFALHPAMERLHQRFEAGELVVWPAVGTPKPLRSHFEAQERIELGLAPGDRLGLADGRGFVDRVAEALATRTVDGDTFRTVAVALSLPLALQGRYDALALDGVGPWPFRLRGQLAALREIYGGDPRDPGMRLGHAALERHARISRRALLRGADDPAERGFPRTPLGRRLRRLRRFIGKARSTRVAWVDAGGWDTHQGQGAASGVLAQRLADLDRSLDAFLSSLGPDRERVAVLAVSEFGRRIDQNGARGTDHGWASTGFLCGAGVRGGRVLAPGSPLSAAGDSVPPTVDLRALLASVLEGHLELPNAHRCFPGLDRSDLDDQGLFEGPGRRRSGSGQR